MTHLANGDPAPDFDLPTDGGGRATLAGLAGKPAILFFYPKDDTSGCTAEAIAFSQLKPDFDAEGVTLLGISPDGPRSHDKFKAKHGLEVVLASDEEKKVLESFGVWAEKSMYGRKYMGVERSTFLLGADGRISRIWNKVMVPGHAQEVLEAVRDL